MTFTYTADLTIDRDFVRFHTGDVRENEALLTDELIASLVATSGSREAAVLDGLEHLIALCAAPTFRADWLQIDTIGYVQVLERRLARKTAEFSSASAARVEVNAVGVYRPDSNQTAPADYTDGL